MSQTASLTDLLGDSGLDPDAVSQLQLTADTLGPAINAGLGNVSLDDVETPEAVLVTIVLDDSSSIGDAGNTGIIVVGANDVLDSLQEAKQSTSVLVTCRYLNAGVLYPFCPLDGAVRLDSKNYVPRGATPLYDALAAALTASAAKVSEFEQGGVAVRAVTVVVTDGANNTSRQYRSASDLKPMVGGLVRSEQHIILVVGISDGYTDFRQVFREAGVPDQYILSPKNTKSEIRGAMAMVSQTVARASQSPGSFSQVALGGFGQ